MVSLLAYRRSIAVELGPFVVNSTTTAASDSVSFTCSSLVNANANAAQFQNCWAYLNATTGANLSACRQIATDSGYDPDAGTFTVARAFSTAVTSGMGFEISSKLPAVTDDLGTIGVREIVNDVVSSMPPIDLLPVSGVSQSSAYDLTTLYPWLTEKSQILGIYFQDVTDDYPLPTFHHWDWLYDANSPRLLLPSEPFQTGETFYVKARRPANTWVKTGGTWAADTNGLQDDSDEALPLLVVVRAQALSTAYRMLGSRDGPDEYREHYREREAFWTQKAYALRWWTDQKGAEDTTPKIRMVARYGNQGYGRPRAYR
jgi:hypothetical protein